MIRSAFGIDLLAVGMSASTGSTKTTRSRGWENKGAFLGARLTYILFRTYALKGRGAPFPQRPVPPNNGIRAQVYAACRKSSDKSHVHPFQVRAILQRCTVTLIGAERVLMGLEIASGLQVSIVHLRSIWWARMARPPVAYRRPAI